MYFFISHETKISKVSKRAWIESTVDKSEFSAQEMEQETTSPRTQQQAQQQQQQPAARPESPEEPNSKQEERKKKAAAFLSKLKDSKEDKKTPVYGKVLRVECKKN